MTEQAFGPQGYSGQRGLTDDKSPYNATTFLVEQMLGLVRTMVPVKVVAVTGSGLNGDCQVDVQPLINQIDGVGASTPHGIVLSLPVFQLQGGGNAAIIVPAVNDIGLALVCDRDISALKATGKQANPGSFRRFNLADSFYLGGILNGAPDQYCLFSADGIKIADKNGNVIEMKSGEIDITAATVKITGALQVSGEVTHGTGAARVTLTQHIHPANNAPPTPGH